MYSFKKYFMKKSIITTVLCLSAMSLIFMLNCSNKKISGQVQGELSRPYAMSEKRAMKMEMAEGAAGIASDMDDSAYIPHNTEEYDVIRENEFKGTKDNPLSTFSIDVDTASYSNVRRFLTGSQLPPKDAVRIEEMINYFRYSYPQPAGEHPFSITTEMSETPGIKRTGCSLWGYRVNPSTTMT